jgi:exodeoxyribonuclease V alpha subunit
MIIPLTTQHYPMLRRNLVYTAVTRGKASSPSSGSGRRS